MTSEITDHLRLGELHGTAMTLKLLMSDMHYVNGLEWGEDDEN